MGCEGCAPPSARGEGKLRDRAPVFWIVVVRHPLAQLMHCVSTGVCQAWAPRGVIQRLTTIAAKSNELLNNTTSDTLRVQSLRGESTENNSIKICYVCYDRGDECK